MAIWTLAIKNGAGLTGNLGQIVAMGTDATAIQAVTADAHPQINDAVGDWNNDAEPGWWLTAWTSLHAFTLSAARPMTDLQRKIRSIHLLHEQLLTWDTQVIAAAPGHPDWQRQFGRDALASAHGYCYLVAHDASVNATQFIAWADGMRAGASDGQGGVITDAASFYLGYTDPGHFRDSYSERDDPDDLTSAPAYYAWRTVAAPTTALALNALDKRTGTIPAGTVIGPGATWPDDLTR